MRKFTAIALLVCALPACGLWTPLAHAQNAVSTAASDNYDAQKAKFKATRFESMAQLRALGARGDGKVVEVRGQVKGSFARDGQRALLFQIAGDENIVIDAPDSLKTAPATLPGATARLLCRVQSVAGADIALTLLGASDAPDPAQLFKTDDFESVVAPPGGQTLPPPDQIVIGDDLAVAPPYRIVAASSSALKNAPKRVASGRTGNLLPSRGLPRTAQTSRAANSYFGFDESQQSAYRVLARRHNPRLDEAMADNIANSILAAAQAHRLDPRFLAAIVTVESAFDPYALSASGAMGLGQLMPFNLRPLGVANAWDPAQNLHGSAKLLRRNLDTYARQANGTLLAVAAYHAGVGAVNRAGKTVPPRAATQKYVWKVYYAYRALAPELFAK